MKRCSLLLAVITCGLAACTPTKPGGQDGGFDPAACDLLFAHDTGGASHTDFSQCTSSTGCGNDVNPPTGGLHCPQWMPCRKYDTPQPRCQWIHNLEHGHIVFAYNCPAGCPEIVDALEALRQEVSAGGNGVRRALLTPDPLLPKRVAVVAWGWSYSADDVNADAIRCLLTKQDVNAYEHTDCQP